MWSHLLPCTHVRQQKQELITTFHSLTIHSLSTENWHSSLLLPTQTSSGQLWKEKKKRKFTSSNLVRSLFQHEFLYLSRRLIFFSKQGSISELFMNKPLDFKLIVFLRIQKMLSSKLVCVYIAAICSPCPHSLLHRDEGWLQHYLQLPSSLCCDRRYPHHPCKTPPVISQWASWCFVLEWAYGRHLRTLR